MEAQLEQIRDQQKASWNKFSPGWKKWDTLVLEFLKPMGDAIIARINPRDGETILDIAAGTGEPGLTIAAMIPNGKVVVTDLAEDMVKIARENAAARGLKNVETRACDVSELPYPDNTFDAISCRMGFMFFPDMEMAAREMVRVLKPGGRIATAVWDGPEKNFWVTSVMGTINRIMELPPPPPGAPGMFRCAKPGLMSDLFRSVGLKHVSSIPLMSKMNAQTTETFWTFQTEVAAPVVAALGKADARTQQKIKDEVFALINSKFPDGKVVFDAGALIIYGEK